MQRVAARQMNQAIREHPGIGIAKELKQVWIDEGGKAESEGGHLSPVNRTRHRNDLGSFMECFLGVRDDHLPWWRDAHALTGSDEDRKSEFVLEILDLFAEGRLCKKESFRGSCNVAASATATMYFKCLNSTRSDMALNSSA